jgi:serine/threonine protein kinase
MIEHDALIPGTELAGYRIVRHIARGGMGDVYEATQLSLDRKVALKVIAARLGADERFRARFRREAKLAAAIDHPNILPVYETGELPDGRLFLTMRLVIGRDLSSLLREKGPLGAHETVEILTQIADALDAAHEHGLVHRDVKPANVLLMQAPGGWRAYLADFGLAKPDTEDPEQSEGGEHTASGEILGTVDYMAPEQIDGLPLDGRADVYSFGCMVYRCLTGEVPYRRESRTGTLVAHANAPIPIPSQAVAGVPAPLDEVVRRAMAKDPSERAASAGELMRWAHTHVDDKSVTETLVVTSAVTRGGGRSERLTAAKPSQSHPRLSLLKGAAMHAALYAPMFAGAYLIGRST